MLNLLTKICNAWKNFIIGTGLDSHSGAPPELSSVRKQRFPGLKGILDSSSELNSVYAQANSFFSPPGRFDFVFLAW